jgi:hypothetical protein
MTGTLSIPIATAGLLLLGLRMESSKMAISTLCRALKGTKIEIPILKWITVRKASTLCSSKWTGTLSLKRMPMMLGSV